jgi:hypothetical protein
MRLDAGDRASDRGKDARFRDWVKLNQHIRLLHAQALLQRKLSKQKLFFSSRKQKISCPNRHGDILDETRARRLDLVLHLHGLDHSHLLVMQNLPTKKG